MTIIVTGCCTVALFVPNLTADTISDRSRWYNRMQNLRNVSRCRLQEYHTRQKSYVLSVTLLNMHEYAFVFTVYANTESAEARDPAVTSAPGTGKVLTVRNSSSHTVHLPIVC